MAGGQGQSRKAYPHGGDAAVGCFASISETSGQHLHVSQHAPPTGATMSLHTWRAGHLDKERHEASLRVKERQGE